MQLTQILMGSGVDPDFIAPIQGDFPIFSPIAVTQCQLRNVSQGLSDSDNLRLNFEATPLFNLGGDQNVRPSYDNIALSLTDFNNFRLAVVKNLEALNRSIKDIVNVQPPTC